MLLQMLPLCGMYSNPSILFLRCQLRHANDGDGSAVAYGHVDGRGFAIAPERVERDAGQGAAHLEAGESLGNRSGFGGGEDQGA
jgi:hypothetical protein